MPIDYTLVQTVHYIYRKTIEDIENGIHLQEHLQEINTGLEMIHAQIILHTQEGKEVKGYEALKRKFFYLKWRILTQQQL
ncbi:hypothetical protein [Emticicia sp. BO119]|uniref:hypothetical protein n=1 Tax=Emticicia sp. BO119 TaxID=2757768 RepID=UPI0015F095DD|nr:hypothetical protein [Emticicia sp. BO119]MBA4850484.1 hypothetical protein [Emticicia sp. BO119]